MTKDRLEVYYFYLIVVFLVFFIMSWGLDDIAPFFLIFFIFKFYEKNNSLLFYLFLILLFYLHAYILYIDLSNGFKFESIGKFLYAIIFFITGYISAKKFNLKKISQLILLNSYLMTIFCLFSFLYTVNLYGFYNEFTTVNGRVIYGYLSDKIYSNTLIGGYLSISIASIAILFAKKNELSFNESILVFIFSLSSIILGMVLGNRSTIFIVLLALFFVLIFKKIYKIKLLIIFIVSAFLIFLYKDSILLLNRLKTDDGMDNSRYRNWMEGIEIIKRDFLGGSGLQTSNGFAHNLWLDIAIPYGVFPTLILIAMNLISWFVWIKIITFKKNSLFSLIYLVAIVGINLVFLIEPIYQGLFKLYCFYIFLIGVGIASLKPRSIEV